MIIVAVLLCGLGLTCTLLKQTLLGVFMGIQLLSYGAVLSIVWVGVSVGAPVQGHLFGIFVAISGIAQLVVGYALAVRLFYLKKNARVDELRSLGN